MPRVVILYGNDAYLNIEAEEMHEDGEFLKVYTAHQELAAMFRISVVNVAYMSEEKKNG